VCMKGLVRQFEKKPKKKNPRVTGLIWRDPHSGVCI